MVVDFACDADMATEVASCPSAAGNTVEGPLQSLGSLLAAERKRSDEMVREGSLKGCYWCSDFTVVRFPSPHTPHIIPPPPSGGVADHHCLSRLQQEGALH